MDRLRINTFMLLLLRAGNQVLQNPQEYGEDKDGVTKPHMLADLIHLTYPGYNPRKMDTLASYFSKLLAGDPPNSPTYLPFSSYRNGLKMRMKQERTTVLWEMDRFCRKYLAFDSMSNSQLVAGLIDVILDDTSFDGEFDIGDRIVSKEELEATDKINLQAFLCSVWSQVLSSYPDTSDGADTYISWTEDAGYNTARTITTDIGFERAQNISVYTDLPPKDTENTDENPSPKLEETEEVKENEKIANADDEISKESPTEEPRVEVYEAPYIDPLTKREVMAQFHVEAKDNGIAIGQVFGGLTIGNRGNKEN